MKNTTRFHGSLLVAFIWIAFFPSIGVDAIATTLVLPNYAETNQPSPSAGHLFLDISREQAVYNASEFPSYPILITEIRWRPDVLTGGPVNTAVSNIQVNLSTTIKAADQLDSNFAANTGTDDTVVFSGTMEINSGFVTLSNGTKAFDIDLPLQTPFTFDASKGNLLIDVRNFTGGTGAIYDNVVGGADGTSRAYNTSDAYAATADHSDTGGEVVQIVYTRADAPPSIDSQPTNLTVTINDSATFIVSASSVLPLGYQWFFEDLTHPIEGATNYSITFTNVQPDQAGYYFVQMTNSFGATLSSNVLLTVITEPLVLSQPVNQIISLDNPAVFSVEVKSGVPVNYQWFFNATNLIAGATNASLMVTNGQLNQLGDYFVRVSNAYGSVTSSSAGLFIGTVAPNYATNTQNVAAEHLFAESVREQIVYGAAEFPAYPIIIQEIRWRPDAFKNSPVTNDTITNIQLSLSTTANGAGTLSTAFAQNVGADNTVVFSGVLNLSTTFTVLDNGTTAFDIGVPLQNPFIFDPSKGNLLLEVRNVSGGTSILYDNSTTSGNDTVSRIFSSDPNGDMSSASDTGGGVIQIGYVPAPLPPTIASQPTNQTVTIGGSATLGVAAGPPLLSYQWFFNTNNLVDGATNSSLTLTNLQPGDAGIYSVLVTDQFGSTLSSNAVLTITADPPSFTLQPTNQTVLAGSNVTFSASAVGSLPLSYQWFFNTNTLVPGATNASLTITNIQAAQGGAYSVQAINAFGSTNTTNAFLTITFPPAIITLGSTNVMGGNLFDMPVILAANGNENVLNFSVGFNTQQLAYANVSLGSNASDASLLLNTSQAANGKVGVGIQLPPGETFTAGTQEVARVTFNSAILSGTQPVATPVNFTNQPINKLLFDVQGNKLATNFISGSVTISPSEFESDVMPRSIGDQSLDIFDWTEVGRMVAGLDVISNASEFQRADCAPKATSGDGQLKVTDWVQASRYAGATDVPAVVGGPTATVTPTVLTGGPRALNISSGTTAAGVALTVPVMLQSQGNESAVGFSVNFDPAILKYVSITKGSAAASATMIVNSNLTASGVVGVLIALPSGNNFATGAQEVARLNFTALVTTTNGAVTFSDQPVIRAISDSAANELSANYSNSVVTVNPPPALGISFANGNATLSWPAWAAGFNLQGSLNDIIVPGWTNVSSASQTNGSTISVTVPVQSQGGVFRLQHP